MAKTNHQGTLEISANTSTTSIFLKAQYINTPESISRKILEPKIALSVFATVPYTIYSLLLWQPLARFLLLTHIYPPAIDGGSRIIYQLGCQLKRSGHQTEVLTTNARSTDDFVLPSSPGVFHPRPIRSLPVNKRIHLIIRILIKLTPQLSVFKPVLNLLHLFKTGPVLALIPFLKAAFSLIRLPPDYILVGPLPTTTLFYAHFIRRLIAAVTKRLPQIIVVPCFHHQDPAFRNPLLLKLLRNSDYIAALTDFESQHLSSILSPSEVKIFTLGAGVNQSLIINRSPSFPPNPHFLFLGNFAAHKGVITLLNAFALIHPKYPHSQLTLAGQTTLYFPQIIAHLRSLPPAVQKSIRLRPRRYNQKTQKALLDSATCLVLPSTAESFGLVITEAWARGKPAIVADIPAPAGLTKAAKAGFVFPQNNSLALSKALNRLASSPRLASELGSRGLTYVKKHYTWDKINQCLLSKLG